MVRIGELTPLEPGELGAVWGSLLPPEGPAEGQPAPFPQLEIREGGYGDNLMTLGPKALIPLLALEQGGDPFRAGAAVVGLSALGDIRYTVQGLYSPATRSLELLASLHTLFLSPLLASLAYKSGGGGSLSGELELPLYRSLSPGLDFLSLGLRGELFEKELSRLRLEPFTRLDFGFPLSRLTFGLASPLERRALGSDRDSLGLLGFSSLSHLVGPAEVSLEASGAWALEGARWRLPAPRGYPRGLSGRTGLLASPGASFPLLRIRGGLWNPAAFLEDLFAAPFLDWAANDSAQRQLSCGLELHLELKALAATSILPLDAFLRLGVTQEGSSFFSFFLTSAILEPLMNKRVWRWSE